MAASGKTAPAARNSEARLQDVEAQQLCVPDVSSRGSTTALFIAVMFLLLLSTVYISWLFSINEIKPVICMYRCEADVCG